MEIVLIVGVISVFCFLGFFLYTIWDVSKQVKLGVFQKKDLPKQALPLAKIREIRKSDLVDYHFLCSEIQKIVNEGKTEYSSFQFQYISNQFKNWAFTNFFFRHHIVLSSIMLLLILPVGFIPLIIWAIVFGVQYQSATKVERIFNQYFRGELLKKESPHNQSTADEISKLHKMKQDGVISEEEFHLAKKKLVS